MSKTALSEHIYGYDEGRDSNTIEVLVNRLRRKLSPELIRTHRGQGYQLERLYRERALQIELRDLDGLVFQGDGQDLEEMLGNLMDNACKWARSRVRVSGSRRGPHLRVEIEDDGPGIPRSDRDEVLLRGRRLDESAAGTGLGLAIVRDLAELYRGSLELTGSGLGGLRAALDLPVPA